MENEITAPMTRVDMRNSEIVISALNTLAQWAWSKEEVRSLERRVKEFKRLLIGTFDWYCEFAI